MTTVLVTGAGGALGQAVVGRLRANHRFRVVAALRNGGEPGSIRLDVRHREQVATAVREHAPDWILHLASTYENAFDEAYAVNADSARHLLDAVRSQGSRARVLLAGSAAEYGLVRPDENPIREDHALRPVSLYGLTKAWQTQLAGYYSACGVDVVVARIFNLDGPNLSERLFIGRLQRQIMEVLSGGRSHIEVGSLSATRDYLPIDEATEQILAIAAHGDPGEVYHVASGRPVKMRELLARHLAAHGLDTSIVRESPGFSNRIGYDVPEIFADVSRIRMLMNSKRKQRAV